MTQILRTANQYYVGDIGRNFGMFTRQPFARTEILADTIGTRTRFDDFVDRGAVSDVVFASGLKGAILAYDLYPVAMSLGSWTINSGSWAEVVPPDAKVAGLTYLHSYDSTANLESSITGGNLPVSPCFMFLFSRQPMTPIGMSAADQNWALEFGAGYRMEWGRGTVPTLYRGEAVVSTQHLDEGDWQTYATAPTMAFQVRNLLGNLYITSSAWRGTWIVKGVGEIPAGNATITGNGGEFWFNLSPLVFETSGYFETDWIEHFRTFPDAALVATAYPEEGTGADVTIEVIETRGTAKRYRVTLTGDGAHTPVVQAFQYRYDPTFASISALWKEITPWVDMDSPPTETLPDDITARTLTLNLIPGKRVNGQTLYDFVGPLTGTVAARYRTGVVYADVGPDVIERGQGFIEISKRTEPIDDTARLELQQVDRWDRLAKTALLWAPCCAGLRVDEAISLIAQWAGIPSSDIIAETIPYYLESPEDDFSRPPWLPTNGTKAAEFIRQIADAYGVRVYFDGSGKLRIRRWGIGTAVATYSYDAGADEIEALVSVDTSGDRSQACNMIVIEGQDGDGRAIYGSMFDHASLTDDESPRYLGFPVVQYERKPDLSTQAAVNAATREMFEKRTAGDPGRQLVSESADLWRRWPGEAIDLERADDGDGQPVKVRITNLSTELGQYRNRCTVSGEVRS
jgi:hypothetical protein